jgi:hypothetical protein
MPQSFDPGYVKEPFLSLVREMINRGSKKSDETLNPLPDDSVLQRRHRFAGE